MTMSASAESVLKLVKYFLTDKAELLQVATPFNVNRQTRQHRETASQAFQYGKDIGWPFAA